MAYIIYSKDICSKYFAVSVSFNPCNFEILLGFHNNRKKIKANSSRPVCKQHYKNTTAPGVVLTSDCNPREAVGFTGLNSAW